MTSETDLDETIDQLPKAVRRALQKLGEPDLENAVEEALRTRFKYLVCQAGMLTEAIERLEDMNCSLEKKIVEAQASFKVAGELGQREKAVEQREIGLGLTEATIKLEAATMVNERIMSFVDSLMRNTEFRRSVTKDVHTEYLADSNGGIRQTVIDTGSQELTTAE